MPERPRIAVTAGDPAGVGPELCLRLLADAEIAATATPIVFGSAAVLRRVAETTGLPAPARTLAVGEPFPDAPAVLDLDPAGTLAEIRPGRLSATAGRAAFATVGAAIDAALAGQVAAVTTGPVNKAAIAAAGIPFPGHTELFADRTASSRYCMMQYSDAVTASFVTCHVGLRDVPALITQRRVLDVIELSAAALSRLPGRPRRILVCGLNPHAGEGGLFGAKEEEDAIVPAIESARAAGLDVVGPLPPDTAFLPARRAESGCTVCMYHDQGHIPLKALAFDRAVNITLGLPIVRTSVDHGTAFDIAWQGEADPRSLFEAVRMAAALALS